jgi:hypothetical protein
VRPTVVVPCSFVFPGGSLERRNFIFTDLSQKHVFTTFTDHTNMNGGKKGLLVRVARLSIHLRA